MTNDLAFHSEKKHSSLVVMSVFILIFTALSITSVAQSVQMKINKKYLNIPVGYQQKLRMVELSVNGKIKREFPVQIAADSVAYWIYIDVSEFKGQTVTISSSASQPSLQRIYQDDRIAGSDSLYHEYNRPQFHFTVKRGWSNDINGPIYYHGQYHLFWQAFPFGLLWNTSFMYWGHAVSKDLIHWEEREAALLLDSLGSPWSGTAAIDHQGDLGVGKDALILFYTAYDRDSHKQVQCIAYSNDNGKTFTRIKGNPVIDSNWELNSNDTRDPKVFWYEPTRQWVMVLFEKDGMSIYNSTNMRNWMRKSHFKGLFECPDFFELPVDGNTGNRKWVIHGGSSDYFIGSFDGSVFKPETERLHYAEGRSERRGDYLYAAETFENMPDGRRVQIAWGRIDHANMPFTQMMLFPTEFTLKTTPDGIRLRANPISEIEKLHAKNYSWSGISVAQANQELANVKAGPLHVQMTFKLEKGNVLSLRYQGNELLYLTADDLPSGENHVEFLIDQTVAEIFINNGERYIVRGLPPKRNNAGLEFDAEKYGPFINSLNIFEINSIW